MRESDEAATPSFEMTWSSTTSSGYCSQEDSDSELEQYFTARTSFIRKPQKEKVKGSHAATPTPLLSIPKRGFSPSRESPGKLVVYSVRCSSYPLQSVVCGEENRATPGSCFSL